jgi:hypothetical protein
MRLQTLLPVALLPAVLGGATAPGNHPTGTAGVFMVDKLGAHVRFFDPVTLTERSSLKLPTNPARLRVLGRSPPRLRAHLRSRASTDGTPNPSISFTSSISASAQWPG